MFGMFKKKSKGYNRFNTFDTTDRHVLSESVTHLRRHYQSQSNSSSIIDKKIKALLSLESELKVHSR